MPPPSPPPSQPRRSAIPYAPRRVTPAHSVLVPLSPAEMERYRNYSGGVGAMVLRKQKRVENLLGGDEAMRRSRKPEVYADAAYVILNKPSREFTGRSLLCEDVLVDNGVTDLSVYDCVPGSELGVDLWVDTPNPPGYTGP